MNRTPPQVSFPLDGAIQIGSTGSTKFPHIMGSSNTIKDIAVGTEDELHQDDEPTVHDYSPPRYMARWGEDIPLAFKRDKGA